MLRIRKSMAMTKVKKAKQHTNRLQWEELAFFFLRQIARTFPTIKFPSEAVHDEQERIVFCVWCLFMLPNKTRNDDKSTRNNARYFDFRLYLFNCNSQQSKLNIQLLLLNRNCNWWSWSDPPPPPSPPTPPRSAILHYTGNYEPTDFLSIRSYADELNYRTIFTLIYM